MRVTTPAQGGSRGRWASASSVRRPAFEPQTHDWASTMVPGTPRIRQNPRDGMYVGGRYASVPLLLPLLLLATLFHFLFLPPPFSPLASRPPPSLSHPAFLSFSPFFSLPTQLSGLFHYGAPMCPDVAVTFFLFLSYCSSFHDGIARHALRQYFCCILFFFC